MGKHILIASAWPYANGSLHLGHIASSIGADVLARYHRLRGDEVLFVSGSDCHGTPIVIEAIKQDVSPLSIAQHYHKEFKDTFEALSFTYDIYTATTDSGHIQTAQDMFMKLHTNGTLYTKTTEGLYSPFLDSFLPDRFVEGRCPHCGYDSARGDQCDGCTALLDPLSLLSPRVNPNRVGKDVPSSDLTLEVRETEHFYLKLSAFQEELDTWVAGIGDAWRPNALQLTRNFLKRGLQDRAITRDITWGIPVPVEGYENKRIYVWFEAVLGYLSASQQYAKQCGTPEIWEHWWKSEDAVHYYIHGKDNILFHTVILPALLLGVGALHLPNRVFSSEYLSLEGEQFSTSRGYGVRVSDFLKHFDSELLRYFLIAQGPETADLDFRWAEFGKLVNGELIGTLGNLVNRICAFAEKNYPEGVSVSGGSSLLDVCDSGAKRVLSVTERAFDDVGDNIERGKFRQAFREILKVAEEGNRFAHEQEPWKRVKEGREGAQTDVLVLLHVIRSLSVLIHPFLPKTAVMIGSFFGDSSDEVSWQYRPPANRLVVSGTGTLFRKVEEEDVLLQREKLKG